MKNVTNKMAREAYEACVGENRTQIVEGAMKAATIHVPRISSASDQRAWDWMVQRAIGYLAARAALASRPTKGKSK
jgi:hypothetical protein